MQPGATSGASQITECRTIPFELIEDARKHVYEAALRTPLVRLNYSEAPCEIYLKLENLQPIGSFKIRGAYNAVRLLPENQRRNGVWTVSAGNAAQGVALAAQKVGVPCKVLVMDTAPANQTRGDSPPRRRNRKCPV
jgi:threonine dehydratase